MRTASYSLCAVLGAQHFDEQEAGSDADGGVGDVEVGPVIVDDVDLEEVDDVGEAHAVVEVAERAAEDEREREADERELAAELPEQNEHDDDGEDREGDEQIAHGCG